MERIPDGFSINSSQDDAENIRPRSIFFYEFSKTKTALGEPNPPIQRPRTRGVYLRTSTLIYGACGPVRPIWQRCGTAGVLAWNTDKKNFAPHLRVDVFYLNSHPTSV